MAAGGLSRSQTLQMSAVASSGHMIDMLNNLAHNCCWGDLLTQLTQEERDREGYCDIVYQLRITLEIG